MKMIPVHFYCKSSGKIPVREWIRKKLTKTERKILGKDIMTIQYGWPLGLPLVRHLEGNLWEIRSILPNKTARIIFMVDNHSLILLHAFIKKTQKTPPKEIKIAQKRLNKVLLDNMKG